MNVIGKVPRWIVERDPSWERLSTTDSSLPEWIKKGSGLRARCGPADWYCEIRIANRHSSFVSSESMQNRSAVDSSNSPASELKKYLSSRYLNPGFYTNELGLPRTRKLW